MKSWNGVGSLAEKILKEIGTGRESASDARGCLTKNPKTINNRIS
jgi:hypothetical protein